MKKEMLINVLQPEECRIAIVEDGVLEELYVERTSHESYTGNIYKGKIVNLEPAIQAAFVDFSVGRNGFLHVSDVEPQYFHRHPPGDEEPGPRPRGRDRDRGKRREPRRDHGRGREERRPGLSAEHGDVPPAFPSPPPRSEERPRERDRGRERERPDQSIRGRRDHSEPPRRFGEGLADQDPDSVPQPLSLEPPPEPAGPPYAEDIYTEVSEPSQPKTWSTAPERGWDEEIGWRREPEYERASEPWPQRESRHDEPTEPPAPGFEREEPFDPDLPPSRTHRSRSTFDRDRPRDQEGSERARHRVPPSFQAEPEPRDRTEPGISEPEIESFGNREPRRGRGRGRPPAGPGRGRPSPAAERGEPAIPEPSLEPAGDHPRVEPDFEDIPPFEGPPRRRGGRAAIRSRGGDWDQPRETPAAPEPGIDRPADTERRRAPEVVEPSREREPERDRSRDRDRERPRPHARAGEPGYIPRRERLRSGESTFGSELFPAESEWPEREVEHLLEETTSSRAADIADEEDLNLLEDEAPAGPGPARPEARRRRRRRGRRREHDREPSQYEPSPLSAPDDLEADYEDFPAEESSRPFARGTRPDAETLGDLDDLDLEEMAGHGGRTLDEDELEVDEPRAVVEEEIDAELEQEIRKEIEEIEELEREMGLRGGPEPRPRPGDELARGGRPGRTRGPVKPPIQEIFRRGDEVLIQVIKESIGTKGPTLSTYISIPGRYLVLMPGLNRVGVSRKIVDEGQRRKLREIMLELNPPKGLGFIVRTAGLERTKRELARDLAYLLRLWKVILRRIKKSRAPTPIYQESDMIIRTIRDIFTSEIDTIWIDEPSAFERAQDFLRVVMPRFVNRLKLYDEKVPLFHKYGIEDEISKIQRRHVPLPEGGSIVIDQTEALVAIDVNSGNFRVEDDAERTAYEMNLRAAREIARQLRLRDLGGVIVNDFIDMRDERHCRGVERALREAIKRDRARTKILRMSAFGLIEMTRQRIRPSLKRSIYEDCSQCSGAGVVKTAESMAIDVMRLLALATHRDEIRRIAISVSSRVAAYLNNRKRREIARMELDCNMTIQISFAEDAPAEHLMIECFDANGNEVRLHPQPPPPPRRGH
jgi:ribonuclease E